MEIMSKQWNPYIKDGRDVYLAKIEFSVDKTAAGQVTVDYFPSSSNLSMLQEAATTGTLLGTSVLETSPYPYDGLEQFQTRLWHVVYFQTEGECIQIYISMSPEQITNPEIAFEDFQLHGLILHTCPTTERLR
jgi:hypothetical protein